MKKYKLLTATVMSVFLSIGCLGAIAKAADQPVKPMAPKDMQIAVVLKAINSDYWKIVKAGADAAAKELGVKVAVLGPNAETDIAGQVSLMEDQIVSGANALVVAPSQPSAAIAVFDKADAAGIPVFLIDTTADWSKKKSFIGTGNEAGGKAGGEYMAKHLKAGDQVVIIRGALGDLTHDQRTKGAQEAMVAAGLKVVSVQPANSDRNMGMTVMENILQANPDVKGVYCTNDEMALGAYRAASAAKKQLLIIGFDGTMDAYNSIMHGELSATVAQSPYNIGKLGVEAAVKYLQGKAVEPVIDTGTEVVDKTNVEKAKKQLQEYMGGK